MNKISDLFFRTSLQRMFTQSLLIATLASGCSFSSHFGLSSKAYAQTPAVNNAEITSYAQAVLAMEPIRQQAFEEIKQIINGGEVPAIVCNQPDSIDALPGKAKNIARDYCTESEKIVSKSGLPPERFNQITVEIQTNSDLKRQVYNTLLRLQKSPDAP
ncbi:DUF4168 domain-containing protein [Cylindrospermum sp. FACHB-282]|uniref:DUF4168 domain-containing protein n=1 Tax=Cylindrospermum sp. FACHB-282 TaxID=2692794 RepID=UPI001684EE11|nr:DUF4168 domain-containing protein [Cylindrospermum sp. FACHB-282]MBD2384473.1 DUF4168 domain-containing protein [Cylindrospermum sp. FACHB-282]